MTTAERHRAIAEGRAAGETWAAIAARLDYASAAACFSSYRRHHATPKQRARRAEVVAARAAVRAEAAAARFDLIRAARAKGVAWSGIAERFGYLDSRAAEASCRVHMRRRG